MFYKVRGFLVIAWTMLLFGCSNLPYQGKEVVGADEFVMDSYKIREGKFSILDMEGREFSSLSPELLEPYKDVICNGDLLRIVLFHPTRKDLVETFASLNQTVGFRVIDEKVALPDLDPIAIAGLTLEEARERLQKDYREQVRDVQLFVSFQERATENVQLAGLVQVSAIPVDGKLRLFETLAQAKVPTQANLFRSYLVREGQMLPVDFYKLLKEGDMSQNVVMRGGDKVYVADTADSSLYMLGEVGRECALPIPNGFMSLRSALAQAGGIPYTGDKAYIQIIRGSILHPKVYTLHWQHVVRLPAESLLLMPGDIVYVAAKPLTSWNRCVSQLLPTLIGIDLLTKGAKSIGINVP
ncbi:MAG: sugar transporter [Chlamydiae bacterium]|nr:sugar transporter [Chlamydiota bacterium]